MNLVGWIRYILNQHDGGMKLDDLLVELKVLVEDGKLNSYNVEEVLETISEANDIDYLIYGTHRYFVFVW